MKPAKLPEDNVEDPYSIGGSGLGVAVAIGSFIHLFDGAVWTWWIAVAVIIAGSGISAARHRG